RRHEIDGRAARGRTRREGLQHSRRRPAVVARLNRKAAARVTRNAPGERQHRRGIHRVAGEVDGARQRGRAAAEVVEAQLAANDADLAGGGTAVVAAFRPAVGKGGKAVVVVVGGGAELVFV